MPNQKEAKARIRINELLKKAGWRFFDDENGHANIYLEHNVKFTPEKMDAMEAIGDDFEKIENGYVDFLLTDKDGRPLIVLEAKSEKNDLLEAKGQARKYAKGLNCRFIILSNGLQHYFWDLEHGNPHIVTRFPSPDSIKGFEKYKPNRDKLVSEIVEDDYIALIKEPDYKEQAGWKNENERKDFIAKNELKFLRKYQVQAVKSIQSAVNDKKDRFLFEMATGTGKTLTSAAVIKLFLRSGNAKKVLFLVDRLELETQAHKEFTKLLKPDFTCSIYKENKDNWRLPEVIISTVQSLLSNNKYRDIFYPTDFELVISDEAHRSINGNARALFEYFVGYKLGLTATPKDYLKNYESDSPETDLRAKEKRNLLDTYRTFGCDKSEPTFRYSLTNGVEDDYLLNPTVAYIKTDITTQLLSKKGYAVIQHSYDEDQEIEISQEEYYNHKDYAKRFFSKATDIACCKVFFKDALRDPISGEIGKTIFFTVNQAHAAKITQILNEMAHEIYPEKYQSDFALQVTSLVDGAKRHSINFANNKLSGRSKFLDIYRTSKTRVCVTVGMMTTGYDCPDILNLALMRPIFSPTDFIQIKGRGTRKHDFFKQLENDEQKNYAKAIKKQFKLFDFFANYTYFEKEFKYDEVLELPSNKGDNFNGGDGSHRYAGAHFYVGPDKLNLNKQIPIGPHGMRVDRKSFDKFAKVAKADDELNEKVEAGQWEAAENYVRKHIFDKPEDYFTLEELLKEINKDRRVSLKEILQKVFNHIKYFKNKKEIIDDEFQNFLSICKIDSSDSIGAIRYFFEAYILDEGLRQIIDKKNYTDLNFNVEFTMPDFRSVPKNFRKCIPEYIKNYISLNQFM